MKTVRLYDAGLIVLLLIGALVFYQAEQQKVKKVNEAMQSWVGAHESQLYMQWGPPTQVLDDGAGGKIVVYAINRQYVIPGRATTTVTEYGFGSSMATTTYSPPQVVEWSVYRAFWVNRQGYIYHWAWKGL